MSRLALIRHGSDYRFSIFAHPVARVLKARRLVRYFQRLPAGGIVLDYGAGDRPYEEMLRTRFGRYVAADYPATNQQHSARPHVFFDSGSLGFKDGSFDCVLLTEVLEHIYKPRAALTELARTVKVGGHVLGTVPFAVGEHEVPYDYYRYTSFALERMFRESGFEIVELEPVGDLVGVAIAAMIGVAMLPAKALRKIGLGAVGRLYGWLARAPQYLYFLVAEGPLRPQRLAYLRSYPLGYAFLLRKLEPNTERGRPAGAQVPLTGVSRS